MNCCGLERVGKFCPDCGRELANLDPKPVPRWVKAEGQNHGVLITVYPDRHRVPVTRLISPSEAKLLHDEIREICLRIPGELNKTDSCLDAV